VNVQEAQPRGYKEGGENKFTMVFREEKTGLGPICLHQERRGGGRGEQNRFSGWKRKDQVD